MAGLRTEKHGRDGKQNTSDAVMAQRGTSEDAADDFPTPPWATRALIRHVLSPETFDTQPSVLEPACNRGWMADVLKEVFPSVTASDIIDYGYPGAGKSDFITAPYADNSFDWVISNPPFKLADKFVIRGLHAARRGVAMLCRTVIIEGQTRFENLYTPHPPSLVAQFVERVPMVEGCYDPAASTATGYCWVIWDKEIVLDPSRYPNALIQVPMCWIPPCRKELELPHERITGLLMTHRHAANEWMEIDMGFKSGDSTAAMLRAEDRLERAQKEIKQLMADDRKWKKYRPLLRNEYGHELTDKHIRELLS